MERRRSMMGLWVTPQSTVNLLSSHQGAQRGNEGQVPSHAVSLGDPSWGSAARAHDHVSDRGG